VEYLYPQLALAADGKRKGLRRIVTELPPQIALKVINHCRDKVLKVFKTQPAVWSGLKGRRVFARYFIGRCLSRWYAIRTSSSWSLADAYCPLAGCVAFARVRLGVFGM